MQPYQEATREIGRQGGIPLDTAKKAASLGATAAGAYHFGGGLANKAMALLNRHIPEDLAIKGLSKLSPGFGKFIQKALAAGKTFDEARNFLSEKADQGIKEQHQPKESGDIIKQYSPELSQFIEDRLKKGENVLDVGALANSKPEFKKHIEKMVKDHKSQWASILQSVYGGKFPINKQGKTNSKAEAVKQYNAQKQQKETMMQQEQDRFNQQYGQEQQQQSGQQEGPGQQALMGTLQKLLQARGGQ